MTTPPVGALSVTMPSMAAMTLGSPAQGRQSIDAAGRGTRVRSDDTVEGPGATTGAVHKRRVSTSNKGVTFAPATDFSKNQAGSRSHLLHPHLLPHPDVNTVRSPNTVAAQKKSANTEAATTVGAAADDDNLDNDGAAVNG